MLLSSPVFVKHPHSAMAWKRKLFVSKSAGNYVARRASDYLRRRFARRRSYTARMPPVSRAVYNFTQRSNYE